MGNKEYAMYHPFNMEKLQVVQEELPEISAYFYLANQLLNMENEDEYRKIANRVLAEYPSGKLNDKLKEKFKHK
jgi:hypothetical protein